MADISIEPFDRTRHQRAEFRCGKPPLDEFIRTLVTQYEKRRIGKTFVAIQADDPATVVGYYTLAASAVACANLPPGLAKKLPQHPVPVVLLGRLAVDQRFQGQSVGEALLADALHRSAMLSNALGVFAVEVLAIDERAAAFYCKYGFTPLLDAPKHLFLPVSSIQSALTKSTSVAED